MTREEWLEQATERLHEVFTEHGARLPAKVRLSCGWPSAKGLAKRNRVIGECWHEQCSADGTTEIFISPAISDRLNVLETLAHELVHAAVGTQHGHKGAFKHLARAIGLEGKLTATSAGPMLRERLNAVAQTLGAYPHAILDKSQRKKQGTRLHKVLCPMCGYTVRVTDKWIEQGLPVCPCGVEMEQSV